MPQFNNILDSRKATIPWFSTVVGAMSGHARSQRGISPNDKIFERILRLTESSRFDPVYIATKLDDPPPGEIPYIKVAKASI